MFRIFLLLFLTINIATSLAAQDIFLTPYQVLTRDAPIKVAAMAFSADGKYLSVADEKGNISIWDVADRSMVKQWSVDEKVLYTSFTGQDNTFVVVTAGGAIDQYATGNFDRVRTAKVPVKLVLVNLDPSRQTLVLYTRDNNLELFDLKANLAHANIRVPATVRNPMFVGYDRFGQQLFMITEQGSVLSWNPITQKFLRELTLQSGEYTGSRSVLHAAAMNSLGDRFVVGLQEVFIPKGGMQGRNQPERRNMILSYDWLTGNESKRVPMRYRVDEMSFAPGAGHVAYISKDASAVWTVNLEKAEITSTVSLPGIPWALAISGNGEYLAVGMQKGAVQLYYIERNTPAEIRINTPGLDRSYATQVVSTDKTTVEGMIEGNERITKVYINGKEAILDGDRHFTGEADLLPGKNKVRITAENTETKTTTKDFYITYEPKTAVTDKTGVPGKVKASQKKVALVIGNASYQYTNKLNNTVNDANGMAATLSELGFDVMKITDGTYEQMKNAIYAFGDRVQDVDVSVFYYGGHGLEVDGANYLVPVDADIQSVLDVRQKTIPLTGVLRTLEVTNHEGLNMIILDACRNNPFPTGKRGGAGLAKVNAPSGMIIAYATDPGSVASDGAGAHGLYTGELIKQMKVSQRIEDVFMNTRNHVEDLSKGSQRPWEEARLKGVFYLR
jgi:WD40 repeat protein